MCHHTGHACFGGCKAFGGSKRPLDQAPWFFVLIDSAGLASAPHSYHARIKGSALAGYSCRDRGSSQRRQGEKKPVWDEGGFQEFAHPHPTPTHPTSTHLIPTHLRPTHREPTHSIHTPNVHSYLGMSIRSWAHRVLLPSSGFRCSSPSLLMGEFQLR